MTSSQATQASPAHQISPERTNEHYHQKTKHTTINPNNNNFHQRGKQQQERGIHDGRTVEMPLTRDLNVNNESRHCFMSENSFTFAFLPWDSTFTNCVRNINTNSALTDTQRNKKRSGGARGECRTPNKSASRDKYSFTESRNASNTLHEHRQWLPHSTSHGLTRHMTGERRT